MQSSKVTLEKESLWSSKASLIGWRSGLRGRSGLVGRSGLEAVTTVNRITYDITSLPNPYIKGGGIRLVAINENGSYFISIVVSFVI